MSDDRNPPRALCVEIETFERAMSDDAELCGAVAIPSQVGERCWFCNQSTLVAMVHGHDGAAICADCIRVASEAVSESEPDSA